mmetsp:Transcript_91847/g.145254  ORF Transcript_91847/g.145254 Transcript_91847/m.145254 type:complete len:233 (-) Transcript_91847:40-738(-)|eukprot:CAMPEP_0169138294 /NCGR_PEP_ID=MMETSP1015-20121227/42131_1 /TAXON_ID=342587 /ORGANISM="Karlodinium micrum, Strain CCMP2283" /LENGTH=232 /DNA_ID=CAMNT_0009203467 /DNA_START=52 /DNA_END=750 /DNA_ORIENTATION=+
MVTVFSHLDLHNIRREKDSAERFHAEREDNLHRKLSCDDPDASQLISFGWAPIPKSFFIGTPHCSPRQVFIGTPHCSPRQYFIGTPQCTPRQYIISTPCGPQELYIGTPGNAMEYFIGSPNITPRIGPSHLGAPRLQDKVDPAAREASASQETPDVPNLGPDVQIDFITWLVERFTADVCCAPKKRSKLNHKFHHIVFSPPPCSTYGEIAPAFDSHDLKKQLAPCMEEATEY